MVKKIISAVLVLCMVFSLCACGKKSDSASSAAEPTPAPEFIYKSDYRLLDIKDNLYLSVLCYDDAGFYATYSEVVGERDHEGEEQYYDGQFDIYESRLVYVDFSGKMTRLSGYTPSKCPDRSEEEDVFSYESSTGVNSATVGPDGKLYILEGMYESWFTKEGVTYEDPEYWDNYKYDQHYRISRLASDGSSEASFDLEVGEDEYISGSLTIDKNGSFVFAGPSYIRAVDMDGNTVYQIDVSGYTDSVVSTPDGKLYALIWTESEGQKLLLIDPDSKSVASTYDSPSEAYLFIPGGGDYPLYYNSGVTFYGYDPESGNAERLFNWIDVDINGDSIYRAAVLSDGRIVTTGTRYSPKTGSFSTELYTVEKVPYDSVPHKTPLVLATQYLSYDCRDMIIDFNRKNDTYHIEVKDYSEYNTEDDMNAGVTKMITEIMAGNIPDIIDLNGMPMEQLAAKCILEDLYPFIDRDFNRSDFFENVFEACEINGKLYTTIPGFSIETVIGASSIVGDTPGWTYADFSSALAQMPDGCTAFEKYVTRADVLRQCLRLDMDNFVNWETGEVNFNCQEFIDLLNFAKSFPESFNWETYDYSDEKPTQERIASGEQMLMMATLSSTDDSIYYMSQFGTDVTFIGYPTSSGTGNMVYVSNGYAMTSACKDKEAVWSFLKYFFTEDYQSTVYQFPILKSLFEDQLKKAMTPEYVKDDNGNIVLDEDGEKKMIPRFEMQNAKGEWVRFYCLSEAQGSAIRDVVTTSNKRSTSNDAITNIVVEESAAFFSGQKTAADVAKLIQSKVNIYVNEQR